MKRKHDDLDNLENSHPIQTSCAGKWTKYVARQSFANETVYVTCGANQLFQQIQGWRCDSLGKISTEPFCVMVWTPMKCSGD